MQWQVSVTLVFDGGPTRETAREAAEALVPYVEMIGGVDDVVLGQDLESEAEYTHAHD